MIFEAPILEPGFSKMFDGIIPTDILKKMDEMELKNVPVFDKPGSTEPKDVIGVCKKLIWRDNKLWVQLELFDFDISVGGIRGKDIIDINETIFFRKPKERFPPRVDKD